MTDPTDLQIWADYVEEQGQDSSLIRALAACLCGHNVPFASVASNAPGLHGMGDGDGFGNMLGDGCGNGYGRHANMGDGFGAGDSYSDGYGDGMWDGITVSGRDLHQYGDGDGDGFGDSHDVGFFEED